MNRIKSAERSKLRDILMDVLLLYDITPEEKAKLDINKLAYDVIHNVWKYEKKNLLDPIKVATKCQRHVLYDVCLIM